MSTESIKTEVDQLLAQVNEKVRKAEMLLAGGTDEQKVKAAGQLVYLKHQRDELTARSEHLEHHGKSFGEWLKEDWMILMQRLDAFMEH